MKSFLQAKIRLMRRHDELLFEHATQDPEAAQREVLRVIIARNANTVFGREHSFQKIASPVDYARSVPIRGYEDFRPYINRIIAREPDILTAENPDSFVTTSGSTGEPKFIPITKSHRKHIHSFLRIWESRLERDHPGCWDGKRLSIFAAGIEGRTPGGLPFGSMSGLIKSIQESSWILRHPAALPSEIALIQDYDARYFIAMRLAVAESISNIISPNPSTLLRLAQVLEMHADPMLRAIQDGTIGIPDPDIISGVSIPRSQVIGAIRSRIFPNPQRAKALAEIASKMGRLLPRDCWPELQIVCCWLGGNVGFHARRLTEYYGDKPALRDIGLAASEGRTAIPIEDNTPAGVLGVHSCFYEFIPEEEIENPSPRVLGAHQIEDKKRYYIILSGWNGLYRYDINDVVEVQGFYNRAPKLAFVRKGRDVLSITGEKLHLNQVQVALRLAEEHTGITVFQFRLIPDVKASRYDLLVEFSNIPDGNTRLVSFMSVFEEGLDDRE